ncbi:MAG: FAD-binding protein [Bacteroidaceae bacterium]|nr:FAD-binding protein [Bacteroidaceae bacterium]
MVNELSLRILPQQAYNEQSIIAYLRQEKGINAKSVRVLRRSIDARQRTIFVNLTVRAYVGEEPPLQDFEPYIYKDVSERPPVIVVGAGPGGLFAALRLIELGYKPIVIERGKDVRERKKDIARIRPEQRVDPESNYCFGEGGAGAYSDGKLYTRSKKRGNTDRILQIFVQHGASPAILSDAHPHIGTDRLPRVIENMRNTILRCGGEVHFQTKMTGLLIDNSKLNIEKRVVGIEATSQSSIINFQCSAVILATGHSARDVCRYLAESGIDIEAKGLAIGVRLEHPAHLIDQIQYHSKQGRGKWLPAAEYSMVTQVQGRGVYSFCMCPGGFVVPAASGPEQVVVNGMSPSNRGGHWSNSGMVVEIRPEDFKEFKIDKFKIQDSFPLEGDGGSSLPFEGVGGGPLSLLMLQEELERQCWLQANRLQTAPAQRMTDFVNGRLSADLNESSYAPGLIASPLHFWLPDFISSRLREAFKLWGKQKHGFLTSEATVIGIETRTSSPVRILRDSETLQHIRIAGLFPCGEGAGFAGGIVSAGVDGERCAEAAAAYLQ